jgi:gamma-glutamyl:cysteine ligase YbdK (ATP-grasp superfamily)
VCERRRLKMAVMNDGHIHIVEQESLVVMQSCQDETARTTARMLLNLIATIRDRDKTIAEKDAEIKQMRESLGFYADETNRKVRKLLPSKYDGTQACEGLTP